MRKGFSKIRPVLLYDQAFGNRPLPPEKIPKEDVLQTFESWPHSLPISSCPPPSFQEKWKQSCLLLHAWPYVRGKCIFLPAFPHFHRPLPYTLPLLAAFMYNPSPPFSHSLGVVAFERCPGLVPCHASHWVAAGTQGTPPMRYLSYTGSCFWGSAAPGTGSAV